ncbi:MAG: hypothetical protein IPO87_07710 [Flavobacteriales bacterium]|nr:hypothetical protein [Flavobacteriales bacterium]
MERSERFLKHGPEPERGCSWHHNLLVTGTNGCTSNVSTEVTLDEQTLWATAQGGVLNCNVSNIMRSWEPATEPSHGAGPNGFSSTVQNPNVGAAGTCNLVVTGANGFKVMLQPK